MSDRSLLGHVGAAIRLLYERSPSRNPANLLTQTHNLPLLPFDILLGIAEYLHPEDIVALKAVRELYLYTLVLVLDIACMTDMQITSRICRVQGALALSSRRYA